MTSRENIKEIFKDIKFRLKKLSSISKRGKENSKKKRKSNSVNTLFSFLFLMNRRIIFFLFSARPSKSRTANGGTINGARSELLRYTVFK